MSCSVVFKSKEKHILDLPASHHISQAFSDIYRYDKPVSLSEYSFAKAKESVIEKIEFISRQIRIYNKLLQNSKDNENLYEIANVIEDYEKEMKECNDTIAQIDLLKWIFYSQNDEMEIEYV